METTAQKDNNPKSHSILDESQQRRHHQIPPTSALAKKTTHPAFHAKLGHRLVIWLNDGAAVLQGIAVKRARLRGCGSTVVDFHMFRPIGKALQVEVSPKLLIFVWKNNLKHLEMQVQVFSTTQPDLPIGGWMDGLGEGLFFSEIPTASTGNHVYLVGFWIFPTCSFFTCFISVEAEVSATEIILAFSNGLKQPTRWWLEGDSGGLNRYEDYLNSSLP